MNCLYQTVIYLSNNAPANVCRHFVDVCGHFADNQRHFRVVIRRLQTLCRRFADTLVDAENHMNSGFLLYVYNVYKNLEEKIV